ncbi:MAG TPA: sigma factor, partial [Puia sp.]|nr:sigma factor [Puia sp.]
MLPDYYTDPNTTLIRDFNAGKGPAFETIYNQYFPVIYRFCLSLIEKSDEAEDITQETFLKLFQ